METRAKNSREEFAAMCEPWRHKVVSALRSHPSLTILILLTLTGLALRIHYFGGIQGSDDLRHAWGGANFWRVLHPPYVRYHGDIAAIRHGMDFLLWLSFSAFGVQEWSAGLVPMVLSLLGIWAIYLLGRRVGGEAAGLVAAGFLALLPADIYSAGIWFPDTALAICITVSVIWLIRSFEARSRRAVAGWGVLSGAVLGFGFYLKEIAPIVVAAFVLWGGLIAIRNRRGLRVGWVVLGFVAFMALGALHWYQITGDPLYNLRRIADVQHVVSSWVEAPRANRLAGGSAERALWMGSASRLMGASFPGMLVLQWLFGPVMALTPVFVLVFAFARSLRYRSLLLILFAVLVYAEYRSGIMAVRQRYLLLIMPPTLVIGSAALVTLANRLPRRAGYVVLAVLVALTPVGLLTSRPQWHWYRMASLRDAHTVLAKVAQDGQPVFTDPRTMMILYQMNGFRPYPGGLYRYVQEIPKKERRAREMWWDAPFVHVFNRQYGVAPDGLDLASRSAGWVVYSERLAEFCELRSVPIPSIVKNPPANWVRVGSWGTRWPVTLYMIQPAGMAMRPVTLGSPAKQYLSPLDNGVESNSLTFSNGTLSAAMTFGAEAPSGTAQCAGVRLPVTSRAFRLQLSFRNVGDISSVSVYSGSATGITTSWRAYGADLPIDGRAEWYEFGPDADHKPFALTRRDARPKAEFVDIVVQPRVPGAHVGLSVEGLESQ